MRNMKRERSPHIQLKHKFSTCIFREEWWTWPGTTLQQISSFEQLVLQAIVYHTLFLDVYFSLFCFLEPYVLTAFAVWGCLKESYPTSLCCLLCRNLSRPLYTVSCYLGSCSTQTRAAHYCFPTWKQAIFLLLFTQEWHHLMCHHIKQWHHTEPHSSAEPGHQPCKRKT